MTISTTMAVIAGMALALLAGCNAKTDSRPLLTKEVFLDAANKCGVQQAEFIERFDGTAPSISFFESYAPGPKASSTSQCLADALKGYRLESMQIRFRPQDGAVR